MKIIIIGGGFGGMNLARKLANVPGAEVILVDGNNYNYFPPLIYQVASSFIEPSNISYPFRKMFQGKKNIRFFQATFLNVDPSGNRISTDKGYLEYDYLVFSHGTRPNYNGLTEISRKAMPLKNINDALKIRNTLLRNMEEACKTQEKSEREKLLTFVIAGGGPTGVELSGMFAEMNKYIRKKDYPELKDEPVHIFLVDAGKTLLSAMSDRSQKETFTSLSRLGVQIRLSAAVKDFRDDTVYLSDGGCIPTKTLIWVSGVIANETKGLSPECFTKNRRIYVDEFNHVRGYENIFAIGDICFQDTDNRFPEGHPQVAQVAIQQGMLLGENFKRIIFNRNLRPFRYRDMGSMAIISKYKAVADLPAGFFRGIPAWLLWLMIHILPIAGFKNKAKLVVSWFWNFISNDPTLRLIIAPKDPCETAGYPHLDDPQSLQIRHPSW